MDEIQKPQQSPRLGRRAFLRLGLSGLTVPLGAMAPASWNDQSSPLDALGRLPTCRTAANVATVSTPRELRITWNTNEGTSLNAISRSRRSTSQGQPINCSSCLRAARLTTP